MLFPEDLKYTGEHEWLRIDKASSTEDKIIAQIGITDYAQSELGELVYVEVDTLDETLEKDDVFGTVEAVKTTSDLFMPLKGTILAFNPELDENEGDNPGLINEDPYGKGWIVSIEVANPEDLESLLDVDAYQELLG